MGNNLNLAKLTRSYKYKDNSVILITGLNSGIGKELAIQYSKRICRLFLIDNDLNQLEETQILCKDYGSQVQIFQTDMSKEENCKNAIQKCIDYYGKIDIMILANEDKEQFLFELQESSNQYVNVMKNNYYPCIFLTKYAWPYLNKSMGQIVVLSSLAGEIGIPYHTAYCSSKFALTGFFESLRIEQTNKQGSVAITIVCPPLLDNTNKQLFSQLNDLHYNNKKNFSINQNLSLQQCADYIMQGADRRLRKIFFPTKPYIAFYVRPFFPDLVDRYLKLRSRL